MTAQDRVTGAPLPEADAVRIEQLLSEGRPFAALAAASQSLKEQGETHEGLCCIARIETQLGLSLRARRTWRRALLLGESADAHGGFGALLIRDGDFVGGIAHIEAALKLAPADGALLSALGLAHLYLGDAATARHLAARALVYAPDQVDAALCLVRANLMLQDLEKAETLLAGLARQNIRPDEVRLLQAELWSRSGDHEAALFQTAELCEAYPESTEALTAFRKAFRAFRNDTDAAQAFAAYLAALKLAWDPDIGPIPRSNATPPAERVDVVIPVHGALEAVQTCLAAVTDHGGSRLGRIIVVDDASDPETSRWLRQWQKKTKTAKLITLPARGGYTLAVKQGLQHSDSPAFVLLNSDTLVTEGWLDALHSALRADPAIAMAGPLSNAAAWQSYGPALAEDGSFAWHPTPDEAQRLRLCAAAKAAASDGLIALPMLHGFCVIADRHAYESVGGLDAETYPQGYGETQDLSLRLAAAGFRLCVAADCIVFHDRAASIPSDRREVLSQIGREMLYRAYGALNYLCAEMICIEDPALQCIREAISRA